MLAVAGTFAIYGVEAHEVRVEVDVCRGLPAFSLVGLPDAAVRESRERVRAAVVNSGFEFPQQRITASLAPADLRKAGPAFDLAIAAALLAASGQLRAEALRGVPLAGELALDGSVRPVPGVLAMAEAAAAAGARAIAVPDANGPEARMGGELRVIPFTDLGQLGALGTAREPGPPPCDGLAAPSRAPVPPDLADLRGQPFLRRAIEVAAAGGHSLLITGPPGAGKSLAARRLPSILPPLERAEEIEVLRIASACGRSPGPEGARRPFRAPHHTISAAGMVGGGTPPRPGEATLAHRGVLFLDELGEFRRDCLEALRQPMEAGEVTIVRAGRALRLPCRFQLLAAANPCPCGRGVDSGRCECTPAAARAYASRLSGALADRLDMTVAVVQPAPAEMASGPGESSAAVCERVVAARERQGRRAGGPLANAELPSGCLRDAVLLEPRAAELLADANDGHRLSGRGFDRVLRLARTVADLEASERVGPTHVHEAMALRSRLRAG